MMFKIFNAKQIRELDAFTIQHEPVTSTDLMERASKAFVQWFTARFNASCKVGIVCGTGNNGGDGLVIARLLKEWNYPVKVWVVRSETKETEDFKINLKRLHGKIEVQEITSVPEEKVFDDRYVLIDALFGTGLSRPADGIHAQVIDVINQSTALRIAVDVPSGLMADSHSYGKVIRADHTITFQLPKLAFLLPENSNYVGDWHVVNISLSKAVIRETVTPYFYITKKSVCSLLRPRQKFAHKGEYGKALLIAGSYGKMGACTLAARSALRSGLGLLTLHIPKIGYSIVQTSVPEAMVSVDNHDHFFSAVPVMDAFDVIGIGPGLGQQKETIHAFQRVLEFGKPMVIDADALNILSANTAWLHHLPSGSILTPHPKEFERMVGPWKDDFDRLSKQLKLARDTRSVVVLKGAHTSIATPEGKVYFNSTGNPGMATGGSGDVLTGIITSLLAQRYAASEAAIMGVFLHGMAGDLATKELSMHSMLPSDLIDFLPSAFRAVQR